jgi:methyl-accepting chemotaxis protein
MTSRQILLIKSSWSFAAAQAQESGEVFYQRLFELDPTLKKLFPDNVDLQANKLIKMLTYIITHLQSLHELSEEISQLARRHTHYGAKPEHLKTVGQALIDSLAQVNGKRWDKETAEAWQQVYFSISSAFTLSLN